MAYENFFATRLFTDAGAADTTLTLESAPSSLTGRLVLEARNPTQREIIHYTGVSGNQVTGVSRGQGGTTAKSHIKGALVEMNLIAQDLTDALAVTTDIVNRFNDVVADHVSSGLVWTDDTGLTADMSAGVAYINGLRLSISGVSNRAFTASKDTYVDLGDNGVLDYNEVSNGAAAPAIAANHLRIAKVVTNATDTTSITLFGNPGYLETDNGWRTQPILPTTTVYNGNGSYTHTYPSSIAALKSPGMRNKYIRKVTANTYMGGLFNGTNHYFVKTTPTGTLGTVTNNFTLVADYEPTAFASGVICGRSDATAANGLVMRLTTGGAIEYVVYNGGASNYRFQTTTSGLPLNKKTRIAITYTSGTAVIYFNGIAQPLGTVTTSGTAPTVAGTGGDWAIGRHGAFNGQYAPGYISNVAIFDAVLSAATIRDYQSQPLLGSETNCIGAWSLNNTTVNQQAPGTNDLTAMNSVGFTANRSPHMNGINGVVDGVTSHSITMSVSSDGLTEVVQCPEGGTIPTIGGLNYMAYSNDKIPHGFPAARSKWIIEYIYRSSASVGFAPVGGTFYNLGGAQLSVPIGDWVVGFNVDIQPAKGVTTDLGAYATLSTANNTTSPDSLLTGATYVANAQNHVLNITKFRGVSLTAATTYYLNTAYVGTQPDNISYRGDLSPTNIYAECAQL